jgi:hypothetical protein
MATLNDVARVASALPEVAEGEDKHGHGHRTWTIGGKAVRTADLHDKEAVLAANPAAFFAIPHFDGYSAVLVQLRKVSPEALRDALTDGWLACAPRTLADQYAQDHPTRPSPTL